MQELWFLHSALGLVLIDIYMKFIENIMKRFQFIVQKRNCVTKFQGKLLKKCKCKLLFLHPAHRLMLIDICKKLHENSLNSFQVIVLTQ